MERADAGTKIVPTARTDAFRLDRDEIGGATEQIRVPGLLDRPKQSSRFPKDVGDILVGPPGVSRYGKSLFRLSVGGS